jgi:hypothetical protein
MKSRDCSSSSIRLVRGKDAAMVARPPKKTDPVLHLNRMIENALREVIKHAEVAITTEEGAGGTRTAATFALSFAPQGLSGGPLVPYGDVGIRQDHSAEVS